MKAVPKLSGMPAEIKMMIYEDLDFNTRFRVRKCSKSDKNAIDNLPFHYRKVTLCLSKIALNIRLSSHSEEFDNRDKFHELKYTQTPVGTHVQHFWKENVVKSHEVLNSNSHGIGYTDLEYLLSHKKLKIDYLAIWISEEFYNDFGEIDDMTSRRVSSTIQMILEKRSRKLKVKRLIMGNFVNEEGLLRVLPHICPVTLMQIWYSRSGTPEVDLNLEQVAQLEQWKRAKYCELSGFIIKGPFENCLHFSVLGAQVVGLTVEEFDMIVQNYIQTGHIIHLEFMLPDTVCTSLNDHLNSLAPPELKRNSPFSGRNLYRLNEKQCLHVAVRKLWTLYLLEFDKLDISIEEALLKARSGQSVLKHKCKDYQTFLKETDW